MDGKLRNSLDNFWTSSILEHFVADKIALRMKSCLKKICSNRVGDTQEVWKLYLSPAIGSQFHSPEVVFSDQIRANHDFTNELWNMACLEMKDSKGPQNPMFFLQKKTPEQGTKNPVL